MKINVTKTYLPPLEEYEKYLKKIWKNGWVTNQGPLVKELENNLKKFLRVKNLIFVSNGTMALQLALNALGINDGEVITTPFSYVATTSSILWQRCRPVFVDVEPNTFCLDSEKIEKAITKNTKAIMAVHVFGHSCDVEKIENIARINNLKVIYDGAHAFGVEVNGRSLLNNGDISICSFHATKLFHTIEGGVCVIKDNRVSESLELAIRFGHEGDEHVCLGINAKNSEFHAAMGLINLKHVNKIIKERKRVCDLYDKLLENKLFRPKLWKDVRYNYSYYPVVFKSEKQQKRVFSSLKKEEIYPRRYFYPSLNTLTYLENKIKCPISEDIASRIACLPLYFGLKDADIRKISKVIRENL